MLAPVGPVGPTGAPAPPGGSADQHEHPAQEWPSKFWILEWIELVLVFFIAAFIIVLAIYLGIWVVWGCGPNIHARIVQTMKGLNTGWKIALLILIPLFFRPIYKFVFYMRKGPFGSESQFQEIGKPSGGYGQSSGTGGSGTRV